MLFVFADALGQGRDLGDLEVSAAGEMEDAVGGEGVPLEVGGQVDLGVEDLM